MRTDSSMFEQFTLGIEEEFQIVDPHTRELRSHVSEILEEGRMLLGEKVKPEMIQSMIEVGTGVCADIQEARADITKLRAVLSSLVRRQGLVIVAAGTHPFSHWQEQKIYDNARYDSIVEENQIVARSMLTFGLHVHVGIPNPERAIQIMNGIRYLLPHVLALSTSSPFWLGEHTGLKSYRSEVFARFPRTGIPDYFESRGSFERYVELLVKTGCIDDGKKIYWDVRPHPFFPTLEFRICDIPTRVDDTIAIAALFQAMVAFGKGTEVSVRELVRELLEFVDDVTDDLHSRKEIRHIRTILDRGTSADEQLRVWRETGDINAVVDRLIELTMENVPREIILPDSADAVGRS